MRLPPNVPTVGIIPGYERRGVYEIDDIFALMDIQPTAVLDGVEVSLCLKGLRTFRRDLCCQRCRVKGSFFALERNAKKDKATKTWIPVEDSAWHLNLYAIRDNNTVSLMTRDHRHPKSKGGSDSLSNSQTMCSPCNSRKADKILPAISA